MIAEFGEIGGALKGSRANIWNRAGQDGTAPHRDPLRMMTVFVEGET
jgi:hypothetical protein